MILRCLSAAVVAAVLLSVAACKPKPPRAAAAVEPAGPALFENITATSGVTFTYRNGEDSANHLAILESLGGGIAIIDYDGDGLLDLFLPGGGYYTGKDKKDIVGSPCKLFRNLGGGKFKDVTVRGRSGQAGGRDAVVLHARCRRRRLRPRRPA